MMPTSDDQLPSHRAAKEDLTENCCGAVLNLGTPRINDPAERQLLSRPQTARGTFVHSDTPKNVTGIRRDPVQRGNKGSIVRAEDRLFLIHHMNVTRETFQTEVLESDLPVLVDFWAEWCSPCKSMVPLLDQIEEELKGQAKVVKINVEDYPDLAVQYNVRSIPNFLFFKNGEVKDAFVGSKISKDELKQRVLAI